MRKQISFVGVSNEETSPRSHTHTQTHLNFYLFNFELICQIWKNCFLYILYFVTTMASRGWHKRGFDVVVYLCDGASSLSVKWPLTNDRLQCFFFVCAITVALRRVISVCFLFYGGRTISKPSRELKDTRSFSCLYCSISFGAVWA